jgi:sulfite exporter TauE/SafE
MNETFLNVSDEFHSQMEKDQSQFIEFITEGVLLIIISIFGFVGNALSIYVLLRPTVKGIFSNILMGLASFDALFLICAIVTFGLPTGQLGCGVYQWKVLKLMAFWIFEFWIFFSYWDDMLTTFGPKLDVT